MVDNIKQLIKTQHVRIILTLSLIIIMGLIWRTEFKHLHTGFDGISIESGNQSEFVPDFEQVNNIVVCADGSNSNVRELEHIDIEVSIYEESQTVPLYTIYAYDQSIHVNGFTSTESTLFEGLPITLNTNQKYLFSYNATDQAGNAVSEELAFLMYGEKRSTSYLSAMMFFLLTLAFVYLIWNTKLSFRPIVILWILLMIVSLFFMPVVLSEDTSERTFLADCYDQSNVILNVDKSNKDNQVYIKEFGIRNIGYISYSVPVYRFWTDSEYGNSTADNKTSNLLVKHEDSFHILQIPAVFAMSIARRMDLSYRAVLLSGWILNTAIATFLFLLSIKLCRNSSVRTLLVMILMMPSTMTNFYSYSCKGILLALCMFIITIIMNRKLIRDEDNTSKAFLFLVLLIGILGLIININFGMLYSTEAPLPISIIGQLDELLYSSVINYVFYNEYFIIPVYMFLALSGYYIIKTVKNKKTEIDYGAANYYILTSCTILSTTIWLHHLMSL